MSQRNKGWRRPGGCGRAADEQRQRARSAGEWELEGVIGAAWMPAGWASTSALDVLLGGSTNVAHVERQAAADRWFAPCS